MTREQFLNGTIFTVGLPTYKGCNTYSYNESAGCMMSQSRSSIDNRVVIDCYECNIPKVTRSGFEGFTYVMKKKVVVRYRFEDLIEFIEEA